MNRLVRRVVVLSYAPTPSLLLRWIHEMDSRPCDLADLLVIIAMTGDVLSLV